MVRLLQGITVFRKSKIRIAALICTILLFCHCYVVSEFIVGGEAAVIVDEKLAGLWRFPGKPGFMLIARHKTGDFSFHYFSGNFELDGEYFAGKLSKAGGKTFFNVRRHGSLAEKASDSGYIPLHYELDGDQLKIALLETKFFNEAIGAKKLMGHAPVQTTTYSSAPTRITSRGEELAKFILDNWKNPVMLEKAQTLERIKVDLPAAIEETLPKVQPPAIPQNQR